MLKITQVDRGEQTIVLHLEGRLVGPWIDEIQRECDGCLCSERLVVLELSGITYADPEGAKILRQLRDKGTRLQGASGFIQELLRASP